MPARDLAEAMQPPATGSIRLDASGRSHRRGSGERASNNIGALRRDYEQHLYGPPPRAPYAGSGTRAAEPTRQRQQALAKVCERWPDVTASRIFMTFGDHGLQRGGLARSPGGCLRQLLQQDAPGGTVRCPSKSTLHADLNALRAVSRDQKPSGRIILQRSAERLVPNPLSHDRHSGPSPGAGGRTANWREDRHGHGY